MRRFLFFGAMFLVASAHGGEGTTGATSLKLASGARGQGMGEAFTAVAEGAEALAWNPAGLAGGTPKSLLAGFQPMAQDVSVSQLGGAAHVGRFGVGAGYNAVAASHLDAIDSVGNKTGSFDAKDQTFLLAGAFGGPAFAAGVTGKVWSSQIDGKSASAVMADLGVAFQNPFLRAVRHGLVLRHLGGPVSYVSQKDPLPTTAVFGTAVRAGRRLLLSGDYGVERAAGTFFAAGAEWSAVTSDRFGLALRGGYNSRRRDAGSLAGAAVGAGLSWRAVALDYAWVPFGDIGDAHSFTLRMNFGNAEPEGFQSASRRAPRAAPQTVLAPQALPPPPPSAPATPRESTVNAAAPAVSAASAQTAPPAKGKVVRKKSLRRRANTLETVPPRKAAVR